MADTSSENISAALKFLEEAAEQKKDELRTVISGKYTNLKNLIMETESSLKKSFTNAKDQTLEAATQVKEAGVEKAREIASEVDKSVHQNPWLYIAGSAVFGVLLGCILCRSRK